MSQISLSSKPLRLRCLFMACAYFQRAVPGLQLVCGARALIIVFSLSARMRSEWKNGINQYCKYVQMRTAADTRKPAHCALPAAPCHPMDVPAVLIWHLTDAARPAARAGR